MIVLEKWNMYRMTTKCYEVKGTTCLIISKFYSTSTPEGSYSAKTGEFTRWWWYHTVHWKKNKMLWFYSRELHCLRTALCESIRYQAKAWTKCPTRPDTQGAPRGGYSLHPTLHIDSATLRVQIFTKFYFPKKNASEQMTPKWPWTLQGQSYPTYHLYPRVQRFTAFLSTTSHFQDICKLSSSGPITITAPPSYRSYSTMMLSAYRRSQVETWNLDSSVKRMGRQWRSCQCWWSWAKSSRALRAFPGENGTTCWSSAVKAVLMESVAHSLVTDSLSWGMQEDHLECWGSTVTAAYRQLADVAVLASGRAS